MNENWLKFPHPEDPRDYVFFLPIWKDPCKLHGHLPGEYNCTSCYIEKAKGLDSDNDEIMEFVGQCLKEAKQNKQKANRIKLNYMPADDLPF